MKENESRVVASPTEGVHSDIAYLIPDTCIQVHNDTQMVQHYRMHVRGCVQAEASAAAICLKCTAVRGLSLHHSSPLKAELSTLLMMGHRSSARPKRHLIPTELF